VEGRVPGLNRVTGFVLAAALVGCGSHDVLYVGAALTPIPEASTPKPEASAALEAATLSESAVPEASPIEAGVSDAPPLTWQEHWYEHSQLLDLIDYDDAVAIYFDHDVDRVKTGWIFSFVSKMWKYSLATYGSMGPSRLYAVFHQGKYEGCHMDNYFSSDHDNRNVIDCGFDSWDEPPDKEPFLESHMASLVIEFTSRGKNTSPIYKIWGDGNWAEFYQYDLYRAMGMASAAQTFHDAWVDAAHYDDFPRQQTHWFRDWFYPLWSAHAGPDVMVRFFVLLSAHFPTRDGIEYARSLNWGEYVHFTSGAAGTDLRPMATTAFGWPAEWEAQYQKARADFPQITY
jgi:hypothetical protein